MRGLEGPKFQQGAGTPAGFAGSGQVASTAVRNLGIGQTQGLNRAIGADVLGTNHTSHLNDFGAFGQAQFFLAAHDQVSVGQNFGDSDGDRTGQACCLGRGACACAGGFCPICIQSIKERMDIAQQGVCARG